MSGDWLKTEIITPEKPEIFRMAQILDLDPDAVFGKLFRVWAWFDQHTIDGNAPLTVTALINRKTGVSDFTDAMQDVGWLIIDGDTVTLPNFDRHNGKTAKNRALTAKRVKRHNEKTNAKVTPEALVSPLPREEKRREENKRQKKEQRSPRKARLPSNWKLTDKLREYCKNKRPELDPDVVAESFADFWHGDGRAKLDWDRVFMTWVRNEKSPRKLNGLPKDERGLMAYAKEHNLPEAKPGESLWAYRERLEGMT